MSNHTKAPWKVHGSEDDGYSIFGPPDDVVCELSDDDRGQAKANATLIAAAPEMLRALENILDVECYANSSYSQKMDAWKKVETSIAKARNE